MKQIIAHIAADRSGPLAQEKVNHYAEQCGGQCDQEIHAELIFHLSTNGSCGGNGSIGDDGEVIAEESTAVYSGKVQRNTGSGLLRDGQRNRRDGNQSTGGCANGSGDQSGNDKDARENEMNGENAQAQVHNAGNTAHTLAYTRESAGYQKDHTHEHAALITGSLAEFRYFLRQRHIAVHQERDHNTN